MYIPIWPLPSSRCGIISSISEDTHSVFLTNYSYDFFCHKLILSVFELHVNGICNGIFLSVSILQLSIMSHAFFTWLSSLLGLSLSLPSSEKLSLTLPAPFPSRTTPSLFLSQFITTCGLLLVFLLIIDFTLDCRLGEHRKHFSLVYHSLPSGLVQCPPKS